MSQAPVQKTQPSYGGHFDHFKLRLLMKASENSVGPLIDTGGKTWQLLDYTEAKTFPPYTCVSYAWGSGRRNNPHLPLGPGQISARTLLALKSTIINFPEAGSGFWIDAYSIPVDDKNVPVTKQEKLATLESMGYIYKNAVQVAVVLPDKSYAAMSDMIKESEHSGNSKPKELSERLQNYTVLEEDEWIRSVWTYQEVMGSNNVFFLSENSSGPPLPLLETANALGYYQSTILKHGDGLSPFSLARRYPRLDEFITLAGDWLVDTESYALKVMANMDRRETPEEKNYWYARIGAITSRRQGRPTNATLIELAMKFMDLCDEMGDFSYIFSAAPRESDVPHTVLPKGRQFRSWRPFPDPREKLTKIPAIVAEHNSGTRQPGKVNTNDGSLRLEKMAVYPAGSGTHLSADAKYWLSTWSAKWNDPKDAIDDTKGIFHMEKIGRRVFEFLTSIDFKGSEEYIVVEDGLFFPLRSITEFCEVEKVEALVSTAIIYIFGSPGLLRVTTRAGSHSYVPGIMIGAVGRQRYGGETVTLN